MGRSKLKKVDGLAQKKLNVLETTLRNGDLVLAARKATTLLALLRDKATLFRLVSRELHDELHEALAMASSPVSK